MPKVERPFQQLRFSAGHAPNPSATPDRRIPTSSHSTTDNRANRSTDPGAKPMHTADRAPYSDARTTMRQPPDARTHHDRQGPGQHRHSPPQHNARLTLIYPLTRRPTPSQRGPHSANAITTATHTHSPHPKTSTQAKLSPPGPSGALTIYTYFIFLCTGRIPGQPRLARPPAPQARDPTKCAPHHRSADTPTTCLAHRP